MNEVSRAGNPASGRHTFNVAARRFAVDVWPADWRWVAEADLTGNDLADLIYIYRPGDCHQMRPLIIAAGAAGRVTLSRPIERPGNCGGCDFTADTEFPSLGAALDAIRRAI